MGTTIVAEGDTAKTIDVIVHGIVETSVTGQAGETRVVDQLRAGDYFGLTSVLMETPSFLTFKASTNVTLVSIDIECLRRLLLNRPDIHDEFAIIMNERMQTAEVVRASGGQTDRRFTMKDFLRRLEQWTQ